MREDIASCLAAEHIIANAAIFRVFESWDKERLLFL